MNKKQHNEQMNVLAAQWKLDDRIDELTEILNKFINFSISEALSTGGEMEACRQKMILNREALKIIKKGQ